MPAKCHPNMKWLETVEAQEDNILSFNQANTLINKYGDELKGLFGMTSVATPASAEAVTQAGKCGADRRRRPRHAQRDEALCREGLRQVRGRCGTRWILAYARICRCCARWLDGDSPGRCDLA